MFQFGGGAVRHRARGKCAFAVARRGGFYRKTQKRPRRVFGRDVYGRHHGDGVRFIKAGKTERNAEIAEDTPEIRKKQKAENILRLLLGN